MNPIANLFRKDKTKNIKQCAVNGLWSKYFDNAEPHMETQWNNIIWPIIKTFNFSCVLELAPGAGRNTRKLSSVSKRIYAVDLNNYALKKVKGNLGSVYNGCEIEYHKNNGCSLPMIKTGEITCVYCWDAAVHFDKGVIKDYVEEFSRVLVKGGRGFIHHSDLGENANSNIAKNPGFRSNMSRNLFEEYCLGSGLHLDLQKTIKWHDYNDCISVFTK